MLKRTVLTRGRVTKRKSRPCGCGSQAAARARPERRSAAVSRSLPQLKPRGPRSALSQGAARKHLPRLANADAAPRDSRVSKPLSRGSPSLSLSLSLECDAPQPLRLVYFFLELAVVAKRRLRSTSRLARARPGAPPRRSSRSSTRSSGLAAPRREYFSEKAFFPVVEKRESLFFGQIEYSTRGAGLNGTV